MRGGKVAFDFAEVGRSRWIGQSIRSPFVDLRFRRAPDRVLAKELENLTPCHDEVSQHPVQAIACHVGQSDTFVVIDSIDRFQNGPVGHCELIDQCVFAHLVSFRGRSQSIYGSNVGDTVPKREHGLRREGHDPGGSPQNPVQPEVVGAAEPAE